MTQVLRNLVELGLQTMVTDKALMDAAESLASLKPSNPVARTRSKTLLAELNKAATCGQLPCPSLQTLQDYESFVYQP